MHGELKKMQQAAIEGYFDVISPHLREINKEIHKKPYRFRRIFEIEIFQAQVRITQALN
jgi:hypothetical protein